MAASAWLGCLLSLAWAVAGLNPHDGDGPPSAISAGPYAQPVAQGRASLVYDERLQHLQQAEAHLQAAGLEQLIPVLEEAVRREVLLDQLAEKVGQLQTLEQEVANLRERLGVEWHDPWVPAQLTCPRQPVGSSRDREATQAPPQILVQLRLLEVPCGKLGALGGAKQPTRGADPDSQSVQVQMVDDPDRLAQTMEAWRASGRIKVLAEPKLVTVSGRPATISTGGAIPVPVVTADKRVAVQFRHVGTRLDVVPVALHSGMIRLELRAEVKDLEGRPRPDAAPDLPPPATRVRTVNTELQLAPGQTAAIGGLIQSVAPAAADDGTQDGTDAQNPGDRTELVVLATAELIDGPDRALASGARVIRQAARPVPNPQPPRVYGVPSGPRTFRRVPGPPEQR